MSQLHVLLYEKSIFNSGHIKHNLGVSGFLLRGLAGVKAEFSILTSCFNITRMMRLPGTEKLIELLRAVAIPENNVELIPKIVAKNQPSCKSPLPHKICKKYCDTASVQGAKQKMNLGKVLALKNLRTGSQAKILDYNLKYLLRGYSQVIFRHRWRKFRGIVRVFPAHLFSLSACPNFPAVQEIQLHI